MKNVAFLRCWDKAEEDNIVKGAAFPQAEGLWIPANRPRHVNEQEQLNKTVIITS